MAPRFSRDNKSSSTRPRRVTSLLVLVALGFVACFAEPEHDTGPTSNAEGGAQDVGGASARGGKGGGDSKAGGRGGSAGKPIFSASGAGDTGGELGEGGGGEVVTTSFCHDAAGEPLPARKAITSDTIPDPGSSGPRVLTLTKASLFRDFQKATCGVNGCHGGNGDPLAEGDTAFQVTVSTFDQRPTLGDDVMGRVTSADPEAVMPPGYGDGSKRSATDPTLILAQRLVAWQEAGFPPTLQITLDDAPPDTSVSQNPYLLSPKVGTKLTNIGSCVPDQAAMLDPFADEMAQKDAAFAAMSTFDDLPDTLIETDLVSLDSFQLSRRRVFSYAPTYPLFTDNAGKMRYVRVPVGQTIQYDDALHDFVIPDNTRFYKTFLKEVTDQDGNVGYRKMETRVIVVRRDQAQADGSYRPRALRATYAWDRDERMARKVTDAFRSGEPAADRLCAYITDERVTRDPSKNPISADISETCEYMTADELSDPSSGAIRHYSLPSTDRCDQCHMGSSSHSYVLAFNPWQVDRRAPGEGGIYEDPKDDELTQLERLIEYGVVTGIEPGQAKLEDSQLVADPPRAPRNDYELQAQGYIVGNCGFCHKPNGFPVVQNPALRPFNLWPSATGGVFQFPLDLYSPRAKVGRAQDVRLPYITPVFGDANDPDPLSDDKSAVASDPPQIIDAAEKPPDLVDGNVVFLGPWRSLIWRNVYSPFTYQEDGTVFVHMPRNGVGYDCRLPKIMASWMLSIPSTPKDLFLPPSEYDQPVREVTDQDPKFMQEQARYELGKRLDAYARGITGQWCPPDDDIVDPDVLSSPEDPATGKKALTYPQDNGITGPRVTPNLPYEFKDAVPDHAHFIATDTTDPPGRWVPRRPNWKELIATREVDVSEQLNEVVDQLQSVHLSAELADFALEELPMGLWLQECQGAPEALATPTVGDLFPMRDLPLHRWLSGQVAAGDGAPLASAHVHGQSRGEAIFRAICQNCHGSSMDSKSPLAATIVELSGGQTRVANFVNGLFGPASAPGAYAKDEFAIGYGATPEDWQARYVLFMGLGGTQADIPISILNLVSSSPFYGQGVIAPGESNPNMLGSAERLCFAALADPRVLPDSRPVLPLLDTINGRRFAAVTGHYELWESLCALDNEPVVRVFDLPTNSPAFSGEVYRARDDVGSWVYPATWPVGNQLGHVELGIQASNAFPWCIRVDSDTALTRLTNWKAKVGLGDDEVPVCPDVLFTKALDRLVYRLALNPGSGRADDDAPLGNQDFTAKWLRHGAINAGLSAFTYMRGVTRGEVTPSQPYDFCRQ